MNGNGMTVRGAETGAYEAFRAARPARLLRLAPVTVEAGKACSGCRRDLPAGMVPADQDGWLWCDECAGQIREAARVRSEAYAAAGEAFHASMAGGIAPPQAWRALSAAERAADRAYDVALGNA